jgi:hypothetical protein
MPAKKAPKKAAKKASATAKAVPSTNGTRTPRMDSQVEKIVKMRKDGKVWKDIADAVGGTVGQVILAYEKATVKPSEKIKDISGRDVVRLRKEGVSWGRIAVRGGITEVKVRSMFEETSGNSSLGERIGKGGRHPNGTNVVSINARKNATEAGKVAAKKSAKKATANAKKAVRRPTKKPATVAAGAE